MARIYEKEFNHWLIWAFVSIGVILSLTTDLSPASDHEAAVASTPPYL